jgi:hypothetical protein
LTGLLKKQTEAFREHPQDAGALGPVKENPGLDASRFAAWTMVARVLLNLDEFITRE